MNVRSLIAGGALLFGALAQAQETPPPPGPPRAFQLPTPTTLTLENGIEVTFIDFGVVPKVSIAIAVRTGALNEGGNIWLSSLTGDLLEEGTQRRTSQQIAADAAQMGGELSVSMGDDESSLSLDVLSEFAPDAVALLAEVLTQPLLPESELARIKQDYLRALSVQMTRPQSLASAEIGAALYPNHAYGQGFPTPEQLKAYGIADVRKYYEDNFGARRTHVYVAGKYNRGALEKALRTHLGSWKAGPAPLVLPPPASGPRSVKLLDRPGAPQSTLRVGLRVIDPRDPDFMALSVANTVLGGGLTSRITMNLREVKGWAYSPNSSLGTHYHDVTWMESADVQSAATGPALAEVFKEIDALRRQPPSEAELNAAKNYRNGAFLLANATRGGLISQYAFMNLQELPADWLTTWLQRLYAVTPQQVTQAARQHIDPAKMSVVVVGDLATVRKQVEAVEALRGVPIVSPSLPSPAKRGGGKKE